MPAPSGTIPGAERRPGSDVVSINAPRTSDNAIVFDRIVALGEIGTRRRSLTLAERPPGRPTAAGCVPANLGYARSVQMFEVGCRSPKTEQAAFRLPA